MTFESSTTSIQNIDIYKLINTGDSIASKENSAILKIYKPNKIIAIDLKEIYYCDDSYISIVGKRWIKF